MRIRTILAALAVPALAAGLVLAGSGAASAGVKVMDINLAGMTMDMGPSACLPGGPEMFMTFRNGHEVFWADAAGLYHATATGVGTAFTGDGLWTASHAEAWFGVSGNPNSGAPGGQVNHDTLNVQWTNVVTGQTIKENDNGQIVVHPDGTITAAHQNANCH